MLNLLSSRPCKSELDHTRTKQHVASCLQEFIGKEGLTLVIRSHEGADARRKRPDNDRLDGMNRRGHTTVF